MVWSKIKKSVKAGVRTLGNNLSKASRAGNQLARNLRRITPTKSNLQSLRSNIVKGAKEAKGKVNEIGNNFEDSFKQYTGKQDPPTSVTYAKPSGSSGSPNSASTFDATTVKEDKYNADGSLALGSQASLRIKRKKKRATDTDITTGIDASNPSGLKIKIGGIRT